MQKNFSPIIKNSELPEYIRYYWGYQYDLAREVLVPYLRRYGAFADGMSVCEIGCGEGGVLMAFEGSASELYGTDIDVGRLRAGEEVAQRLGLSNISFSEHNIVTQEPPAEWREKFDLIILRDVIEHLDSAEAALRNIRLAMKPGGHLFVTFPPYNSPFGGHQQLLQNFWGKIPYMHLLPDFLFRPMIASGAKVNIEEVERLREIRLSPKKFLSAARSSKYTLVREEYYLLRPVFKMKFGLPAIRLTPLKSIPGIKEIFSLEAAYLLRK